MSGPRSAFKRTDTDTVRRVLMSEPRRPWVPPEKTLDGLKFTLESIVDQEWVDARSPAGARLRPAKSGAHVWLAGPYLRTEEIRQEDPPPIWLRHPELGAVYLDVKDRTFLHLGPEQAIGVELPVPRVQAARWRLATSRHGADTTATLIGQGVELQILLTSDLKQWREPLLDLMLPDRNWLVGAGLPLDELANLGTPVAMESWQIGSSGKRQRRLSTHRVVKPQPDGLEPRQFSIPEGFRDLRDRSGREDGMFPTGAMRHIARPVVPRNRPKGRASVTPGAAERATATVGAFAPPKFVLPEVPLDSCLPSTLLAVGSLEIRQYLLDHIAFLADLIGARLTLASGARDADGRIVLNINWLDQLGAFDAAQPNGDGLFCLLRDPPPNDNPLGGGQGLLDRAAESEAERLVEVEDALPLGGADDPLTLDQAVADAVAAVVTNEAIKSADRWQNLLPEHQAAIREAVLAERLGVYRETFRADVLNRPLPSAHVDYLWVTLRAQTITVSFDGSFIVPTLRVREEGRRIEVGLRVAGIAATFQLERAPGLALWVTAVGALVIGGAILFTSAGAAIAALVVLGPLGVPIILGMLTALPTVGALGAFAIALLTFLSFDIATVNVSIAQPIISAFIRYRGADDEFAPEVEDVAIEGDLTVAYSSEIPSGVHQVFAGWISALASDTFEDEILDTIADRAMSELNSRIRDLPHLRLPQPISRETVQEVTGFDPYNVPILRHDLRAGGSEAEEGRLLAAAVMSNMSTVPPVPGLQATQCDPDAPQRLRAILDTESEAYAGYAFSQNLLNGFAHAMWIDGVLRDEIDEGRVRTGLEALVAVCSKVKPQAPYHGHVWAASSPRILLTPQRFCQEEYERDGVPYRVYMEAFFDDLRLCLSCGKHEESKLEVQFALRCIAHLGLGRRGQSGQLSLIGEGQTFADLFFDREDGRWELAPLATQGITGSGPSFDHFEVAKCDCRADALDSLQPLLRFAAQRVLRTTRAERVPLRVPGSPPLNEQIYDDIVHARLTPVRTTLYVILSPFGAFRQALPNPAVGRAGIDWFNLTCQEGVDIRELVNREFSNDG